MKIHAYKSHTVGDLLAVRGLCGTHVEFHPLPGEDVKHLINNGGLWIFTLDPDEVSCKSCRRAKKFHLMHLDSLPL